MKHIVEYLVNNHVNKLDTIESRIVSSIAELKDGSYLITVGRSPELHVIAKYKEPDKNDNERCACYWTLIPYNRKLYANNSLYLNPQSKIDQYTDDDIKWINKIEKFAISHPPFFNDGISRTINANLID